MYETIFCEILKLISYEIKSLLKASKDSNFTGEDEKDLRDSKIDVKSFLSSHELQSSLSNNVCLELSKLLIEVLAVKGAAIKSTIHHYYQIVELNQSKIGSPGKKFNFAVQKASTSTDLRISHNFTPIRMDLENLGEEYNEKSYKKLDTGLSDRQQSSQQLPLKVNDLMDICQALYDFDKDQVHGNGRPLLQTSEDLMQRILIFMESYHKELKKEVMTTLKGSHLKTIYMVWTYIC